MAVPKKRMSNARTASRRAQWDKITAPTLSSCPSCGGPTRPHHVCLTCGKYKGREVLAISAAVEETATTAGE